MKRVGVIGLGDMGMGLAQNLIRAGYPTAGFDLRAERLAMLNEAGGTAVESSRLVGEAADAVFVMVLNGAQMLAALQGPEGALAGLRKGSTVILSATVKPEEARQAAEVCAAAEIHMLDSPVSGGQSGAAAGTLSMMVAGPDALLAAHRGILEAVGERILHVGDQVGQGQTVKAALQAVIGTTFAGLFEALVLSAKAGVDGQVMQEVLEASMVSSNLMRNCIEKVRSRQFAGTGSNIATIHKDLTITLDLARREGAAMFTTAAAMELMQAGLSSFPGEDNWAVVKVLERIADTEVH